MLQNSLFALIEIQRYGVLSIIDVKCERKRENTIILEIGFSWSCIGLELILFKWSLWRGLMQHNMRLIQN